MSATHAERLARAIAKQRPPCTTAFAIGDTVFYDLKNANDAWLMVRVTGITHKRVVVVQVDGEGRPVGSHRSVIPESLAKTLPATATVVG